ncbi:rhamnan synthesis F family protein [Palleronia sp. KMU-117]|uniref:rhamnan synthesis F family protein n=1 Tax=Palleronia sp. KMU-117 TaxID=3434108 RepID=UPI003D75214A
MIPAWKLRREVRRVVQQIATLPSTIVQLPNRLGEPRRRRLHDARFRETVRLRDGTISPGSQIGIFLIYQPHGIAPSVLATCDWLVANGFAPLVVSNCPVTDADFAKLAPRCWQTMERPNFGYDFGGYRDAIRHINGQGLSPGRLIIMNDSVWFPMRSDVMERLVALPQDIVGLLQDEKVAHDRQGGMPTDRMHLESYFFLIRERALSSEVFRHFWRDYRMTDFKPNTIKFGEIGFSKAMAAGGLSLGALTDRSRFLAGLRGHDAAGLRRILSYAAYADRDIAADADRVLAEYAPTEAWRERAFAHITRAVNRKRFNASFPLATDEVFGIHFLKKSREPIFSNMRRAYVRLLDDNLVQPPPPEIEAEVRKAVARDFPEQTGSPRVA